MRTKLSETTPRVEYVAEATIDLPKLPAVGDSVSLRIHAKAASTSTSLVVGAVTLQTYTTVVGTVYAYDLNIVNIGSGEFLVSYGYSNLLYVDSTNDYAASSITAYASPVQASGNHTYIL